MDFENERTARTLRFLVKLSTLIFLFIFEFSSVKCVLQNRQSNSHHAVFLQYEVNIVRCWPGLRRIVHMIRITAKI